MFVRAMATDGQSYGWNSGAMRLLPCSLSPILPWKRPTFDQIGLTLDTCSSTSTNCLSRCLLVKENSESHWRFLWAIISISRFVMSAVTRTQHGRKQDQTLRWGWTFTWFCKLATAVQRWGWTATKQSLTKAMVLDSSSLFITTAGGNSLITHRRNAEGTDEPEVQRSIKGQVLKQKRD